MMLYTVAAVKVDGECLSASWRGDGSVFQAGLSAALILLLTHV